MATNVSTSQVTDYPVDSRIKFCRVSPTGPRVGSAGVIRHLPDIQAIEVETERDGEILLLHIDEVVKALGSHEFAGDPRCIDVVIGRRMSAAMVAAGVHHGHLAAALGLERDHLVNLLQGRACWSLSIAAVGAIVLGADPVDFMRAAFEETR